MALHSFSTRGSLFERQGLSTPTIVAEVLCWSWMSVIYILSCSNIICILHFDFCSLHLYFVSDAAHHIFRYINEQYTGETKVFIHPIVSIETLADPSSPFFHDSDSFSKLIDKDNLTFQMIHDSRRSKTFSKGDELFQMTNNLQLYRTDNQLKTITQNWYSTEPTVRNEFRNQNFPHCNVSTRKTEIKSQIDQALTFKEKLYISQAKRMGDHGQIIKIGELPQLIKQWSSGDPEVQNKNIEVYGVGGTKTVPVKGTNLLNWETTEIHENDIKKRVFHITGDFPAFGCAISKGLNSIIVIPNTPHIIIAICTY